MGVKESLQSLIALHTESLPMQDNFPQSTGCNVTALHPQTEIQDVQTSLVLYRMFSNVFYFNIQE